MQFKIPNNNTGGWDETNIEDSASRKDKDTAIFNVLKNYSERTKQIQDDLEKIRHEMSESSNKNIETLGLFVALFTFISVEIQFFKSPLNLIHVIAYSLFLLGALVLLITVLDFILKGKSWSQLLVFLMSIILIGFGIYYINYGTDKSYYIISRDEIDKMLDEKMSVVSSTVSQTNVGLFDLKNCLKKGGWKNCF